MDIGAEILARAPEFILSSDKDFLIGVIYSPLTRGDNQIAVEVGRHFFHQFYFTVEGHFSDSSRKEVLLSQRELRFRALLLALPFGAADVITAGAQGRCNRVVMIVYKDWSFRIFYFPIQCRPVIMTALNSGYTRLWEVKQNYKLRGTDISFSKLEKMVEKYGVEEGIVVFLKEYTVFTSHRTR